MLLPLLLAGCSGSAPDADAPPIDETLQRETRAGHLAYELERNEEAAAQYRAALTRAQARDDPDAIGDIGYNLAVAELSANTPDKALAAARATRVELERRGAKPFPALLLVEATALYRTGAAAEADRAARLVQRSEDPEAAARATFLRGLIADDRGDEAGLAAAADALTGEKSPPFEDRCGRARRTARTAARRSGTSSTAGCPRCGAAPDNPRLSGACARFGDRRSGGRACRRQNRRRRSLSSCRAQRRRARRQDQRSRLARPGGVPGASPGRWPRCRQFVAWAPSKRPLIPPFPERDLASTTLHKLATVRRCSPSSNHHPRARAREKIRVPPLSSPRRRPGPILPRHGPFESSGNALPLLANSGGVEAWVPAYAGTQGNTYSSLSRPRYIHSLSARGKSLMALRKSLILRRPRRGRLEGRAPPIQPIINFFTGSQARARATARAIWPGCPALRA
jgi:hypothetical protein